MAAGTGAVELSHEGTICCWLWTRLSRLLHQPKLYGLLRSISQGDDVVLGIGHVDEGRRARDGQQEPRSKITSRPAVRAANENATYVVTRSGWVRTASRLLHVLVRDDDTPTTNLSRWLTPRRTHHRHERIGHLELGQPIEHGRPPLRIVAGDKLVSGLVHHPQLGRVVLRPLQCLPLMTTGIDRRRNVAYKRQRTIK